LDAKRKITIIATVLIIVTLIITIFAINQIQNPDIAAYTAQAQKIFNQARTAIEQIRNTTMPQDISLIVYTKQQTVDRWGKASADADLVNILRQEKVYKGLFMMSENDSLYQATVDWTASWGAATLGNEIYVIKENFDPWDMPNAEATFVHELTHVWQPDLVYSTTFDTEKAHAALAEGDASYMGDYFLNQYNNQPNPANSFAGTVIEYLIDIPSLNAFHPTPNTINSLNWFPYIQGKTYVIAIIENGNWTRLNLAYEQPYTPSTTEQILHPEKYFANESSKLAPAPSLSDSTWTRIQTNRGQNSESYGEYFIQIMLSNWLKDNNQEAQQGAAGWAADNFTYYEKDDNFLFTWNIAWDSVNDASEFNQAFIKMMNLTGAISIESNQWYANGRYLTLIWDQSAASILIVCSTNQSTVQPSFFT
jgi:hypothetical protein